MAKTYAAFYLPPEKREEAIPDPKETRYIKDTLKAAWKNFKGDVSGTIKNYEEYFDEIADNMDIQCGTAFTQRYAAGALSKIINGEAVTNKTMLDSLFNTYAPALNAGLAQSGFNSLVEMRNAVQAGNGNINVPNFIQGFSNGLNTVKDATFREDISKYGEEIPIDVITKCVYEYDRIIAQQKIDKKIDLSQYVGNLDPVTITINANVKNENAELWNINDFSNKIMDLFMKEESIIFRAGKSIYENCIISSYIPTITSIYDISFEIKLKYDYSMNLKSQEADGYMIMNPNPTNKKLANKYSEEVYGGIITANA